MLIKYYIKTRNINLDRRAQKEWKVIKDLSKRVELIYSSDDDLVNDGFDFTSTRKVKLLGGAAPYSLLKRLIGSIQFSFFSSFISFKSKEKCIHWVNDPALFLLVILLKVIGRNKVVWDLHELPPKWVLDSIFLTYLFKLAYKSTDCVIHTNLERSNFLESKLKFVHQRSLIIRNYPELEEVSNSVPVALNKTELGKYVYLQNTIGEGRCDIEVLTAIKQLGLTAVHAGKIDYRRLEYLKKTLGELDFCEFVGSRSLEEINFLLLNSQCTMIFYKNLSMNNWLCEPNRLYHAQALGRTIVSGNNPTLISNLKNYPFGVITDTDGSDIESIRSGLIEAQRIKAAKIHSSGQPEVYYWSRYYDLFNEILELTSA